MYIIKDSDLLAPPPQFRRVEPASAIVRVFPSAPAATPVIVRLQRFLRKRRSSVSNARVARAVSESEHSGVILDFAAARARN